MSLGLTRGLVQLQPHDKKWEEVEQEGILYRGSDVEHQLLYVMWDMVNDTRTHA